MDGRLSFLESVDLSRARFHKLLSLSGAHFAGSLTFDEANIEGSLILHDAEFFQNASFNLISIGRLAKFEPATFKGLVNFIGASVGAEFNCSAAHFNAVLDSSTRRRGETVSFNGMRVGLSVFFDDAGSLMGLISVSCALISSGLKGCVSSTQEAMCEIDMSGLSTNSLVLDHLRGVGGKYASLKLGRAQVRNDLFIEDVHVKEFTAPSLLISGPAVLSDVSVSKKANLQACRFDSLDLTDVSWPRGEDAFLSDGMVFRHIECIRNKKDQLGELPKIAKYSALTHAGVADFLRNQGSPDMANQVTMDQHDREAESMNWINGSRTLYIGPLLATG